MGKNWVKGKKTTLPPRELKEISAEYTAVCGRVGDAKYKISVLESAILELMRRISELDREATERNTLDKQTEKAKEVEQPVSGAV